MVAMATAFLRGESGGWRRKPLSQTGLQQSKYGSLGNHNFWSLKIWQPRQPFFPFNC